jgi:hypothetical protein
MERCRPRPPSHRRPYPLREHDEKAKSTLLPLPSPSRMPLLCRSLAPRPPCPDGPPHRASTQEALPRAHVTIELEPSRAPMLCFAPSFPALLVWSPAGASVVSSTHALPSSPEHDSVFGSSGATLRSHPEPRSRPMPSFPSAVTPHRRHPLPVTSGLDVAATSFIVVPRCSPSPPPASSSNGPACHRRLSSARAMLPWRALTGDSPLLPEP